MNHAVLEVLLVQFCACIKLPIDWGGVRPIEKNHWVGEKEVRHLKKKKKTWLWCGYDLTEN